MNLFKFNVMGIDYDGRYAKLKKLAKELEKSQVVESSDLYGGYSNKEIKNSDTPMNVYKYDMLEFDYVKLEKDDNNEFDEFAVKVYIGNEEENMIFIGYVPKKYAKKVREILDDKDISISAELHGGTYKYLDGDDEIQTDFTDYSVSIEINRYSAVDKVKEEVVKANIQPIQNDKNLKNIAVLGFVLGWLGIHNFMLGYYKKGAIQLAITLISFGYLAIIPWIWAIVESVYILQGKITPNKKR